MRRSILGGATEIMSDLFDFSTASNRLGNTKTTPLRILCKKTSFYSIFLNLKVKYLQAWNPVGGGWTLSGVEIKTIWNHSDKLSLMWFHMNTKFLHIVLFCVLFWCEPCLTLPINNQHESNTKEKVGVWNEVRMSFDFYLILYIKKKSI